MMQQLREQQIAAGAVVSAEAKVPTSFGNDTAALEAVQHGVALYDRSHWGRIQVTGEDRIRFLHNQTTNNFNDLQPGQGCDTVFVTSTARTLDLVTAYVLDDSVLLLTSPGYSQHLIDWMDRFIFFADQVELKDVTETTASFSLLGPASDELLQKLGANVIVGQPLASHRLLSLNGIEVRVGVGSGLAIPGYTLFTSTDQAASLWQTLFAATAIPMGEQLWQQLRIEQGRPVPGQELTDDYNPLEAGLWHTISLSKGCYIGQETIARLHTYRGVKQQLWGIRLSQPAEPEAVVMVGDEKVGRLTSCMQTTDGYRGLAYIRTKNVEPGLQVKVGDSEGELVALPFVNHEYL
ncbi:MAG: folate-binding protein YgfZ [Elainella sp. C42_A2020_010]|nr:folate-binding protein YgfZ [Elainella sp. C42_A2020_010]